MDYGLMDSEDPDFYKSGSLGFNVLLIGIMSYLFFRQPTIDFIKMNIHFQLDIRRLSCDTSFI